MTARQVFDKIAAKFRNARIPSPETDARILLAEALGESLATLPTVLGRPIDKPAQNRLEAMARRRMQREPVSYIVGHTEFMGLRLRCDNRALIPRPETETLVEVAVDAIRRKSPADADTSPLITDIGTGNGCIAVAIAQLLPHAQIIATDASQDALDLARANAADHELADRIRFLHGPDLKPLFDTGLSDDVTAVVSNPPYVAETDYDDLEPEITEYEPAEALLGGEDGLDFYRRALTQLTQLPSLRLVALEFGINQYHPIRDMLSHHLPNWRLELHEDLSHTPRVALATRDD